MWLPGSKALMPRLRYPSSKGPPPLQSCRMCPGTPETAKSLQTMRLTASTRMAFAPPHQEDIFLTALKIFFCAPEGEQERRPQTKAKVQELKSRKKPGLCVLLMSTWMTSTRCYFCPSISQSLCNTLCLWTLFFFLLKAGGPRRLRAAHYVKSWTMYFETQKCKNIF